MATWSLQGEVGQILQILSSLPGSNELHVKTRRYPRFLPGDAGSGFQERSWHLSTRDMPTVVPVPHDSEDVAITWTGVDQASQSTADLLEAIAAGLEKLEHPGAWDYDVHRSTAAAAGARLEIHVFRRF